MKRIFAILLILSLMILFSACNKGTKEENVTDIQKEQSLFVPFDSLGESMKLKTDVFTAKVIAETKAPDNIRFQEIVYENETPVVYTVEVTDTFRTLSVEKGMKVSVIRLKQDLTSTGYYAKEFETGKNYLIAGTVQLVNDKPVIVDTSAISCEILEDKKLTPLSNQSEIYFKDIPTLDSFVNNKDVQTAFKEKAVIPTVFEAYRNTFEEINKPDNNKLSEIIRQAIPIDSKQTIKVTPAQYEMCHRNLYDSESLQTYLDTVVMTRLGKSTDIFTGVVLSKSNLSVTKNDLTFEKDEKPVVYTVKVKNIYRALSVTEDMTVNVVRLVKEKDTMGNKAEELEKGNTYFFAGTVSLLNEKPIIADDNDLTCRLLENGNILSISSNTDLIFDNITNLENFMNTKRIEDLKNYEQFIPSKLEFLKEEYGSFSKVSEILKKAIPIDSEKTIEIPEK